jgi:hypothetical protein
MRDGMTRVSNLHFVFDGCKRARAAAMDSIRAEVEREFAERLANANVLQRYWLWRQMDREIERRLERLAPSGGLYLTS